MAEFLAHYRLQRGATRKLVGSIPAGLFSWAPAPDAFSCGGLVRHMMQAEIFWRRLVVAAARSEPYDSFQLTGTATDRLNSVRASILEGSRNETLGATPEACLAAWSEIQAETEQELASLPEDTFATRVVTHPVTTLSAPLWESCLGMVEHEIHHRGQLSAYLKMMLAPQPVSLFD